MLDNRLPDLTEEEQREGMDGLVIMGGAILAYFLDSFFHLLTVVMSLIVVGLVLFCKEWLAGKRRDGIAFLVIAIITSILGVTFDLSDRVTFVISLGLAILYSFIFLKKSVSDMIKAAFSKDGAIIIIVIVILLFLF